MKKEESNEEFQSYRLAPHSMKFLIFACVLSLIAEFFVKRKTYFPEIPIDAMHGFFAITGFVGVVLCIAVAGLIRSAFSRKEDYYGD